MATTTASPTQTNSAIGTKFQPTFDLQEIAVKAIPGKPVTSRFNGDQVMFCLTDGRFWYADPYIAQQLEQMRIQPGEVFAVQKVSERRGQSAITKVQITAVVPEPIPPQLETSASAGHLTRCYRDAVDVAAAAVAYAREKGFTIAPNFEDIRCLAAVMAIADQRRAAGSAA